MNKNIINLKKKIALCPRCNRTLSKSDLPEYAYVCKRCDENFYRSEAKEG